VLDAVRSGHSGRIGLTYVEWSGVGSQRVLIDWTTLGDAESAKVFGDRLLEAPRSFADRTSISGAIEFAMAQFARAPFESVRRTIDVSGDGTNNSGRNVTEARDQAMEQGVTINGLAIINTQANPGYAFHTQPPGGLPKYFEENVIGGPGAFLLQVENFDTFAEAITRKLVTEIAGTPPASGHAALR
jgi:hypothetical protein